ncbi:Serine-threonine protein kinase [Halorhabdus tiamatea SARL4B]|nr:Serine-threonine protein kinase [Halorhabdus tiamatea SARL4B]
MNAEFPDANLRRAEFPDANLMNAEFPDADLWNAKFPDANLMNAEFPIAKLRNARFLNAYLLSANFHNADLRYAKFLNAHIRSVDFTDSNLLGADLSDANASRAVFRHANLQDTVLADTDCRYATFTSTLLYETVFKDTRINSQTTFFDRESTFYDSSESLSRISRIGQSVKSALGRGSSFASRPTCVYEENPGTESKEKVPKSESLPDGVNRFAASRWVYRRLEALHEENALSEEARDYHISKEEAERKLLKERGDPRRHVKTLMWALSKHGESVKRLLAWWVGVIVLAGLTFPFVGGVKEPDGTTHAIASLGELGTWAGVSDVLLNVYFSVITFSTIGYGDLSPASAWSRVLVAGESLVGAILVALLVFVLGRRVAR